MKGYVLEIDAYSSLLSTKPEYLWLLLPRSVSIELALACNSICSRFNVLLVSSPFIGVNVLYLKYEDA